MAAPMEYTEEQLNYYRICYIVTDVLAEGLRTIFKQEWDNRYKATLGEWKDAPKNGMDFESHESPRNRRRNALLLKTMINGDRAEWDCTMLFYAILYSDSICSLHPAVQSNVDDLRKFRNEDFAHRPRGFLSSRDFQDDILKVNTAFHALGLPTLQIRAIQTQTSFPTKELRNVLKKVDNLQQMVIEKEAKLEEKENQRQTLEEQLQTKVFPFCILPPGPTHDVFPRRSEVDKMTQHLIELRDANKDSLSTLYLSGNPGSGKSQLARLAAKRFFDESKETPSAISFVMTLNAESSETLLESYVSFARHCKCPDYSVTDTRNSKDLSTDEKIASLKTLISAKIELYTSWLLVVDNVTSLSHVHTYLPGPENQQWARGQSLITTQDTKSIPLKSFFTQHISVSKGMLPDDACSLLRLLSGVTDNEVEKDIARTLDYQPLALASAAIYVKQVRESKIASKFRWTDFLKKLEKGQRDTIENILAETNPSYPKTMTTATTLALEKVMKSDRVLDHLFIFLSHCVPHPILKDIVVDYIMEMEKEKELEDEDAIGVKISRCPLLLFDEEESGVYIRVHGVVHYVANSVRKKSARDKQLKCILRAASSFSKFKDQDSLVVGTKTVPHLAKLITDFEDFSAEERISQMAQIDNLTSQDYSKVFTTLGKMCSDHSQYPAARSYFSAVLEIAELRNPSDELQKTVIYNNLGLELGHEHVDVATSYNNLGLVHRQLGDLKQAKDCHERALDVRLKKLGPEHVDVATSYSNLGTLYRQQGDLKQAKDCHERALDIRLKIFGPEHVKVADTYINMGDVHIYLGLSQEAKGCYDLALAIYVKNFGPADEKVRFVQNALAQLRTAELNIGNT